MNHLSSLVAPLLLIGLASGPALAEKGDETRSTQDSAPGHTTVARTRTVTATVESVDAAKRDVTLKGPKGNLIPLKAGPEVRNLEQVHVGDHVVVRYQESLSLTLKKDGKELRSSAKSSDEVRSPVGERPAGMATDQVEVTADVIAVNTKRQTVTLRGPKQTVDLWVRDPQQLKLIKVGDQVDAVYTQALALSVMPATK